MGRFTKLWGFAHARASEDRRRFENWSGGLKFGEKNFNYNKNHQKENISWYESGDTYRYIQTG